MNKTFAEEWKLYKEGGSRPEFRGEAPRGEAEFDAPVKVGEIRIFADMARPFVALVAEERGFAGWLLVPVSPFTVPASPREALEGERVYQLWNACTAARSFVARSWRVDEMDADVLSELRGRCAARGEFAADGIVAEYEREFLVSGGDFIPLVDKATPRVVRVSWHKIISIAACFAILLGVGMLVMFKNAELGSSQMRDSDKVVVRHAAVVQGASELLDECADMACEIAPAEERMQKVRVGGSIGYASPEGRRSALAADRPFYDHAGEMARESTKAKWESTEYLRRVREEPSIPAGTERYAEIQENEFRDPSSEPLSTFGLDVDTSSYTTMRRYVAELKRMPPKEAVRLEEWVNYFKYSYPQPKGDDPIGVACEMGGCPWAPSHRLLRVGVQARNVPVEKLPPCNLTFLIDVSGSMGWNGGFDMAKAGLRMLVDRLRPEDRVAIVTYASGTRVLLASTPGTEKGRIRAAIDGLVSGGGTAGGAGIQLAYEEAKTGFDRKANNRVILVTDGDFNVGISTPKALEEFIAEKRESGIFLTVLGVGTGNYQDANMKKLSTAGNGNYAYLDSVLEAKKVMMNEFGGTLFTVAKDVKLQLEFNPAEVKGYRLLGYESRKLAAKDFNDDKKDAGEIGSGHTMTALYEIVPAGSDEKVADVDSLKYQKRTESGRGEVCTVKLRWKKPDGDTSVLREIPVAEKSVASETPSADFRFAAAVAEFALLASDSKFKGAASFASVLERARSAKGEDAEGYRAEFIRLVETAELLSAD